MQHSLHHVLGALALQRDPSREDDLSVHDYLLATGERDRSEWTGTVYEATSGVIRVTAEFLSLK